MTMTIFYEIIPHDYIMMIMNMIGTNGVQKVIKSYGLACVVTLVGGDEKKNRNNTVRRVTPRAVAHKFPL